VTWWSLSCLQRFELNYETFLREKVNDRFEFPQTLDLYPYSTEGLAFKEAQEKRRLEAEAAAAAAATGAEEGSGAGSGDAAPVAFVEEPRPYKLHPKEYYEYQLVGVVVHIGTADSGHYYSLIKERGTAPGDAVRGPPVLKRASSLSFGRDSSLALHPSVAHTAATAEATRSSHSGEWFEFNDSNISVRDVAFVIVASVLRVTRACVVVGECPAAVLARSTGCRDVWRHSTCAQVEHAAPANGGGRRT
jgi:hypothetical protein